MKKYFAILTSAMLIFSMTACSANDISSVSEESQIVADTMANGNEGTDSQSGDNGSLSDSQDGNSVDESQDKDSDGSSDESASNSEVGDESDNRESGKEDSDSNDAEDGKSDSKDKTDKENSDKENSDKDDIDKETSDKDSTDKESTDKDSTDKESTDKQDSDKQDLNQSGSNAGGSASNNSGNSKDDTSGSQNQTPSSQPSEAAVISSVEATVNGTHYIGDKLTAADFTVKVHYSDGSVVTNPPGWSAYPLELTSETTSITVSYGGVSSIIAVNTASSSPSNGTSNNTASAYYDYTMSSQVLALLNEERAKVGLPALTTNDSIQALADFRAAETTVNWSHTRPDGSSCFTAFGQYVSYSYAGENIALGYTSASSVNAGWVGSQGHYANMINANFTQVGISCYVYNGEYFWVEVFIG